MQQNEKVVSLASKKRSSSHCKRNYINKNLKLIDGAIKQWSGSLRKPNGFLDTIECHFVVISTGKVIVVADLVTKGNPLYQSLGQLDFVVGKNSTSRITPEKLVTPSSHLLHTTVTFSSSSQKFFSRWVTELTNSPLINKCGYISMKVNDVHELMTWSAIKAISRTSSSADVSFTYNLVASIFVNPTINPRPTNTMSRSPRSVTWDNSGAVSAAAQTTPVSSSQSSDWAMGFIIGSLSTGGLVLLVFAVVLLCSYFTRSKNNSEVGLPFVTKDSSQARKDWKQLSSPNSRTR